MLNTVIIMGRITKNLELKTTPSGNSVCAFTVAVDRGYVKQGEERQSDFIDCVAWRNTADFIAKHFHKGSMIAINGEIKTRNWEDKNGNKRKATEIQVVNAHFCGEKVEKKSTEIEREAPEPTVTYDPPSMYEVPDDDDLPF